VSPLGISDRPIHYVIRTDHAPGVTLATTDGSLGDPVQLYGTAQALGADEKGTAAFKRRGDDDRHPLFNAPMHKWTVPGPPQRSRKIQIEASAKIIVIGPGVGQPPPDKHVEFWLDYDASGVATFHVLPATPDASLTYSVDATGVYELRGVGGSSSGGSPSAASTADTWATTQAALERRLAAIDRELALAREGAARQIDVLGTRKTDNADVTYYQEKEGGAYQDHWAKKQRELEKEREAVLAELAAHAAKKP